MKLLNLSLACLPIVLLAGTAEAGITMDPSSNVSAWADDRLSFAGSESYFGNTIPTHTTVNAIDGAVYGKNNIDWYLSGDQTILSLGMDHQESGTYRSDGKTEEDVFFTADSNEPYVLSGSYNVQNVGAAGFVRLFVTLNDVDSGLLFSNDQISTNTINERYTLGGSGGENNDLSGSLTGDLIAGHRYELYALADISAFPDADSGASALGNVTLSIGTPAALGPGDFNNDGIVDAGDYVVWRHREGSVADYDLWRVHFGQSITGSGASIESASVPEPSSLALLLALVGILLLASPQPHDQAEHDRN